MLVIVQARMSSLRLPGKVLMLLAGRPLLAWTISRLRTASAVSRVVVATSIEKDDDLVAAFCASEKVPCHRGSLEDVAGRFAAIAEIEHAPAFVRVSGDSPLIDPAVVDHAIGLFAENDCDLVTNIEVRTFPKGQSVEVLRSARFLEARSGFQRPEDLEHVTAFYYAFPGAFRIINFESGEQAGQSQLSVDTLEDFRSAERLIAAFGGSPPGWRELWRVQQGLCV